MKRFDILGWAGWILVAAAIILSFLLLSACDSGVNEPKEPKYWPYLGPYTLVAADGNALPYKADSQITMSGIAWMSRDGALVFIDYRFVFSDGTESEKRTLVIQGDTKSREKVSTSSTSLVIWDVRSDDIAAFYFFDGDKFRVRSGYTEYTFQKDGP